MQTHFRVIKKPRVAAYPDQRRLDDYEMTINELQENKCELLQQKI